ncbi:MAG: hypothetical protein QOF58_5099 [Pseudonocardiales bacterium]|nr:hypothetical protein [Pseudonocardiales bacterium]
MIRRRGDDSGALVIIVAMFATAVFILGALVVEVGAAREARRSAQAAADSAAEAAAGAMYDSQARLQAQAAIDAARNFGRDNDPTAPAGSVTAYWRNCRAPRPAGWSTRIGGRRSGTTCILFYRADTDSPYTKVRVVTPPKDTPGFFGAVTTDVRALAEAQTAPAKPAAFNVGCVLCVRGDLVGGDSVVTVTGGDAWINDDLAFADTGELTVTGDINVWGNWDDTHGSFTPQPDEDPPGSAPGDPFLSLQLPPTDADFGHVATQGPAGFCPPGNYTSVNACTSFDKGIYVIVGGDVTLGASADGALFYLTCSQGSETTVRPQSCERADDATGASLRGAAAAGVGLNGLKDASDYSGFAIIADRENDAPQSLVGSGVLTVHGAVYMARSTIRVAGAGGFVGFGNVLARGINLTSAGPTVTTVDFNAPTTVQLPLPVAEGVNLTK